MPQLNLSEATAAALSQELEVLRGLIGSSIGQLYVPLLPHLNSLKRELAQFQVWQAPKSPQPAAHVSSYAQLNVLPTQRPQDASTAADATDLHTASSLAANPFASSGICLPSFLPPSLAKLACPSRSETPFAFVVPHESCTPNDTNAPLGSFLPPSLALLARPHDPLPSVLGKRATDTRNAATTDGKNASKIKIRLPVLAAYTKRIDAGEFGPRVEHSDESSDTESSSEEDIPLASIVKRRDGGAKPLAAARRKGSDQAAPPRKKLCRRNGNTKRVGTASDIGFVSMRIMSDDGESEIDAPGNVEEHRGWRTDGDGRPVTLGAGLMLCQLISVFSSEHLPQLENLISYLQDPKQSGFLAVSNNTDSLSVIQDIRTLEISAAANDLLYMLKLIQLALNIDDERRKAKDTQARPLGIAPLAKKAGLSESTLRNYHTYGTRLLHLCCAGSMHILLLIACLRLRTSFVIGTTETVRNINSLADALREVKEGKYRPLVRRLIVALHYLQTKKIPVLDNYKLVRGEDNLLFSDFTKADNFLGSVQTNLFTLPSRSLEWKLAAPNTWTPTTFTMPEPAEVIEIKTALKLERTTVLPFKSEDRIEWTEDQRALAEEAEAPTDIDDLCRKITNLHASVKDAPGRYVEIDPDILEGKALVIDDATGLRVVTVITMPPELRERLKSALERLDAILPEFRWENSKRLGYTYLVIVYTWYYRMGEKAIFLF
ncbi:hypothetical protein C8R43DRAFT_1119731 [Mycena crocata]|nr:hypothetical protein C8R43DRAFT_1119731 [Mycena crocata]